MLKGKLFILFEIIKKNYFPGSFKFKASINELKAQSWYLKALKHIKMLGKLNFVG